MVDSEVDESILMDCCSMEITILTTTIYFTDFLRLYHNLYFQKCHVMVSVNIKTLAGLRHIETSALHSILKIVSLCIKCNVYDVCRYSAFKPCSFAAEFIFYGGDVWAGSHRSSLM